ncbi:MAG: ParA family protein [Acidobacteriota bacterium]
MRKIAIVNMKGGMGKTTTAIHVAAGLAGRGQRVLLVDTDPQGNVGHALHVHPRLTIQDLMAGTSELNEVIVSQVRKGLDVIASNTLSFGLERQLAAETQRETILSRRLRGLRGYDAVIVDSSPAMNLLTFNALLFAEEVVIPVGMDLMAIIGARQTLNGVREVQELWPDRKLELLAVLPTFVNAATNASSATMEALEKEPELGARLFRPGIRQCVDLTYSTARRQTIWEYAPRSRGAEDYNRFLDFIEGNAGLQEEAAHGKSKKNQAVV